MWKLQIRKSKIESYSESKLEYFGIGWNIFILLHIGQITKKKIQKCIMLWNIKQVGTCWNMFKMHNIVQITKEIIWNCIMQYKTRWNKMFKIPIMSKLPKRKFEIASCSKIENKLNHVQNCITLCKLPKRKSKISSCSNIEIKFKIHNF